MLVIHRKSYSQFLIVFICVVIPKLLNADIFVIKMYVVFLAGLNRHKCYAMHQIFWLDRI